MSFPIKPPFVEYKVPGVGTVIDPEGQKIYRVRLPDGRVAGFPAASGTPSPEKAAEDIAAALANPPVPGPVAVLTPLAILSRLRPDEEADLAGSTDLAVAIVRQRLIAAQEVRTDDPRTAEGIEVLVAKGIVSAARAEEVFDL